MQPWFHETPRPHLFNEWSWTHFAWGMASSGLIRSDLSALAAHTAYEALEGGLFPVQHRDTSMLNHVGDTLAFMAGRWALAAALRRR